jgi:large repetitive protein
LKRLAISVVFAALLVGVVPMSGSAASFVDSTPCPADGPLLVCPGGYVGQQYDIQLQARGGCDLYWWELPNGVLPAGLTMTSSGHITGAPIETIETHPWVIVHDLLPSQGGYPWCIGDNNSQRQFVFKTLPGLAIDQTESTVPPATVNQPYTAVKFTASTLTHLKPTASSPSTATWSISSGALPTGISFSPDGVLSGTPTQEGSWTFKIKAEHGGISDSQTKTMTVRQPLGVNSPLTKPTQRLEVDVPFTAAQSATGGSGAYTWTLASGTFPAGVVMNPADGSVTGTPTTPGSYPISIKLADTEGRSSTLSTTFIVADRLAIPVFKVKTAIVNRAYRQKLERTGGVAPVQWKLVRGKLPKGVTLAKKLGLLLGKPTKAGTYRVAVEATDAFGVKATANLKIVVAARPAGTRR